MSAAAFLFVRHRSFEYLTVRNLNCIYEHTK